MSERFPLAFSTLGCPKWTFEQAVEQAAANGYMGLEVRVLDGQIIPSDLSAERRREIKAVLAKHNMQIVGLGVSTRFSAADADERRANEEELKRYLALANDLGTPMVRTFGGNVAEGRTMAETIDWVADSLGRVMPAAEAQGVTVMLETHDAFCLGADVARVLAQVEHPRLGAVWDVHHPFRMGESIEETWRQIGPRTVHIHMKDARLRPDGSWQLVLMGEGEVPCRDIMHLLHREGYQGCISAEWEIMWHPEIEEPEVAMPQHARVLRAWMGELG
ncbi:MAG: sugar phosphate isomerase/epimerase family protein [Caldilineaceae bacterium]